MPSLLLLNCLIFFCKQNTHVEIFKGLICYFLMGSFQVRTADLFSDLCKFLSWYKCSLFNQKCLNNLWDFIYLFLVVLYNWSASDLHKLYSSTFDLWIINGWSAITCQRVLKFPEKSINIKFIAIYLLLDQNCNILIQH